MIRIVSCIWILSLLCLPNFAKQKPNVLLLAVDDMNDWIGCLGKTPRAITPNIDKLAGRGVNFRNAHTAGVFCAPSRAAIFSGQFASTTGCYQSGTYFVDHPEIESLQTSFAKAGYSTFGAGKLFHHPAGAIDIRNWTHFFLRNPEQRKTGWPMNSWSEETPFPANFPASIYNRGQEITGGMFLEWAGIPNHREEDMADTKRANWAVEQLRKRHDKPFFLAVGLYAPHYPNYCPQKYFDLYDPDKIELPPIKKDDLEDLPEKIRKMKTARSRILQKLQSLDAWDDAIHGYLANISYADAMIGRVLNALEQSPYADNTIVVLWSDHGYHLGEKGDWGKHTLWERTSNVPFIWAGPGVAKNKTTDVTVSLIDLYPTFREMCGLPQTKQTLEGQSIVSTLANPDQAEDRSVFLPHMHPGEYAIINRDWRYVRYGEDGEELYDLREDPHEWNNLAMEKKYFKTKSRLSSFAPKKFAPQAKKLNAKRDLFVKDDSFEWIAGKGNLQKAKVYRPSATTPTASKSSQAKGKNVLFVICDDLNTHVSTSGYEPITTPNLSKLAKEAITFNRAFCQYPVCGPSRASFLSGLYPQATGVLNNTLDVRETRPGTVSMPQFFKENGYWTAGVGKVFHNTKSDHGDLAWDENLRFENDELGVVREARLEFEAENGSIDQQPNKKKWKELKKRVSAKLDAQTPPGKGRSGLRDDQHKDGKNARQVVRWLEDKAYGEKPFFIALGLQKPHVPFLAPDKYFDLYPIDRITYQPDRPNLWDFLPPSAISKRYEAFGFELAQENHALRKEYMQAYHACVSFIDAQLGLVIDSLKKQGLWDDTIIIFTSDHGYHLGDHFIWGKVTLFDVGAKVPFIVRAPGLSKSGTASEAMVELIDVYPTLADLAELKAPNHLQGISLRPLLGHPDRLGTRKYAYSVVTRGPKNPGYALRNQNWRYDKWPDGEELYNLRTDPQEKNNLAQKDHLKERLEDFRDILAEKQNLFEKN
ncbi:MAG: sulfatase [Verrucomicrobiota bacterium]|nr:sulfatase [Verrucomicrobiota bacterium]